MNNTKLLLLALAVCACTPGTNLAGYRTATASSSYDHNLTAQLLTDCSVHRGTPAWLEVETSDGPVGRAARENAINGDRISFNTVTGASGWIQYRPHGYTIDADSADILYQQELDDGREGVELSGRYPVEMTDDGALRLSPGFPCEGRWRIKDIHFLKNGKSVSGIHPAEHFSNAWMSAGTAEEWVMVDLGGMCEAYEVKLHWIDRPAAGTVETSADGRSWDPLAVLAPNEGHGGGQDEGPVDVIRCGRRCRYVRVSMDGGTADGGRYCMTELEVYGPGSVGKRLEEEGWMLQRASLVNAGGEELSTPGPVADGSGIPWMKASVPGTTLQSFIEAGAVPDPDFGDNASQISDSYFGGDFWYRKTFTRKALPEGRRAFLEFDGINWKAEVFLNGQRLGMVEGAFARGRFDVSGILREGANALAVKISYNAHPGSVKEKTSEWTGYNGGIIGADSPTFMASIGWDWITTVRGRNCGIWNDVRIRECGPVSVSDPLVVAGIGPDGRASMTVSAVLEGTAEDTEVEGWIGGIRFSRKVSGEGTVTFTPEGFPQLKDREMDLWWPAGYGEAALHDAGFIVRTGGAVSDSLHFKAGIREVKQTVAGGALRLFVNGRRVNPMGGNWGFSQHNLKYGREQYFTAVDYHRQMHFNMIRNWVGQVGDEEFYEACDSLGIMVWQDFWLANPYDGPDPDDEGMFLANARDYVSRIRRHPCIAIYCGRNEGYPPESLDNALRDEVTAGLHPGIPYISSSADGPVSGRGPYMAMEPAYYFSHQTGMLHSERGMPNVTTIESLRRMMPEEDIWPKGEMWGKHDLTTGGAQRSTSFDAALTQAYGEPESGGEYSALAQWIGYDGYRAMFEAANSAGRMGLLLWMSHSCWPSLVWCTYDYWFEPAGAFFGCRKACEPIHIQYNAASGEVEVINNCAGPCSGLTAEASVYGCCGDLLQRRSVRLDMEDDASAVCFRPAWPASERVCYLKLRLLDSGGRLLSDNFYFHGSEEGNFQAVRSLPAASLDCRTDIRGSEMLARDSEMHVNLRNADSVPALLVRLTLKTAEGEEILPVEYSDNYFSLMPGESKDIVIRWNRSGFKGMPELGIGQIGDFCKKKKDINGS